jgi:arylsulfate sulfotransferase
LKTLIYTTGMLTVLAAAQLPLYAKVTIVSMTPSVASPQPLGTVVTWTVKAADSNPNPLTFQFNVASGSQPYVLARDFNIGTLSGGAWTAQPFDWATIAGEGVYTIQAIAKDFVSGESASETANFTLTTRVSAGAVANRTDNPLVALFSAASCAAGSTLRAAFYSGTNSPTYTPWMTCNPPISMNVYIAGMLPSTTYSIYSQTDTNGKIANGNPVAFTTGALPSTLPGHNLFPIFTVNMPGNDPSDPLLLWAFTVDVVPVATDLNGNIMWYYSNPRSATLVTRPVAGGTLLTIQNGASWSSSSAAQQLLREIDLAGNIVHETNTGIIANQLVAMGATDATPCNQVVQPAQVGDACLDDFHHDAIRLPNGYTAFLAHIEKLFPPGTQGATGAGPVDILSEMAIVLDTNWQVTWYYDAFEQLDINRTAPLGELCISGPQCQMQLFLSSVANDWTHANTLDFVSSSTNPDSGDFLISMRDQDQVIRVNYGNGQGSCVPPANCIVWYMGPPDSPLSPSAFTLNNVSDNSWPWFSHQHDVTYANNGANVFDNLPLLTLYDNGNTRCSPPPLGLGAQGCSSRGMSLEVDEVHMTVTPAILQPLGIRSQALGGAELLPDGNYFFQAGMPQAEAIGLAPTTGVAGAQILNISAPSFSYRAWQMLSLYSPPPL